MNLHPFTQVNNILAHCSINYVSCLTLCTTWYLLNYSERLICPSPLSETLQNVVEWAKVMALDNAMCELFTI